MLDATLSGYMVLRPDPQGLRAAREQMRRVAQGLHITSDDTDRLLIAVGEAISNAYRHGSTRRSTDVIRLSWNHDTEGIVVTIQDDGCGFRVDPTLCESEPSGKLARGIELMRACADEVHLLSDGGAKVVLRKRVKLLPET